MSAPFDEVPVNRWLGFRLRERGPSRVVIEQDVRDEMLQEGGVVQGGLLTALGAAPPPSVGKGQGSSPGPVVVSAGAFQQCDQGLFGGSG